jgi:hypothetical protein
VFVAFPDWVSEGVGRCWGGGSAGGADGEVFVVRTAGVMMFVFRRMEMIVRELRRYL